MVVVAGEVVVISAEEWDTHYTKIETAGVGTRYGVHVGGLGEEPGEDGRWVAFTHGTRRAIAAVLAEVRAHAGDRVREITLVKAEWWRLRNNCGCGDTCPHEDGSCWDDEDGLCDPSLPPCGDTFGWVGEDSAPDAVESYPVTVWEVVT